jgi:hypothetical protein
MNRDCRCDGSALLITVLLLVLMGLIGLAALDAVTRDRQVAGFLNRKKIAFYAAEAGIAEALQTLMTTATPTVTATTLGDTSSYPHGRPSFRLDPTASPAVDSLDLGPFPGMNLRIGQGGTPLYQMEYWGVRVQGDAPGGTVARHEIATGTLIAN